MVLELIKEKSGPMSNKSEAEEDKLIPPMLALAGIDPSDVRITSARFDGNNLHAEVKARESNEKIIVSSSIPQLKCAYSFEVVQLEDDSRRTRFAHQGTLDVKLAGRSAGFVLGVDMGFHDIVHHLFNSAREEHSRNRQSLEQVGLNCPDNLEINLPYNMGYAKWRFMPQEFLDNIQGFKFQGKFFEIGWPKEEHYPKSKDELVGIVLNLPEKSEETYEQTSSRKEAAFESLKEKIRRLGVVYQEREIKGVSGGETHKQFLVGEKPSYDLIAKLEDIAAQGIECPRSQTPPTAEIFVQGKVSRDSFAGMHSYNEDLDVIQQAGLEQASHISVVGGKIEVHLDKYPSIYRASKKPVTIHLNDATLEEAARLMRTGIFGYCSEAYFRLKGDNDYVPVVKEKSH